MRTTIHIIIISLAAAILTGCQEGQQKPGAENSATGQVFTVDFTPEAPLRYKLTSERTVQVDFGPGMGSKDKPEKTTEKLDLVISYEPIGSYDQYGQTTIKATCHSAKVRRISITGKKSPTDAVELLTGRSFTLKVSPVGKITDDKNFRKVVTQIGKGAFASKGGPKGTIKNPDMISDFIALQWHLWDSIAGIENPRKGVRIGQSWTVDQLLPLPSPIPAVKQTTYTLTKVDTTEAGTVATIATKVGNSKATFPNWPKPYSGSFQMKGMFGFLRNYRLLSVEGDGKQIYNIDAGRIESETMRYKAKVSADFLMPLGDSKPLLTIDQKITIKFIPSQ